eukprot:s3728_g11.t1
MRSTVVDGVPTVAPLTPAPLTPTPLTPVPGLDPRRRQARSAQPKKMPKRTQIQRRRFRSADEELYVLARIPTRSSGSFLSHSCERRPASARRTSGPAWLLGLTKLL